MGLRVTSVGTDTTSMKPVHPRIIPNRNLGGASEQRDLSLGFRVQGLGFRVQGFGFRVWECLGFWGPAGNSAFGR